MTKVTISIEERLIPVKELSSTVNWDERRINVTDFEVYTDEIRLTLSDDFNGKEAVIYLTAEEFQDYADDFLKLIAFTETPLFWFIKDFATGGFRKRIFKEVKDVLLFRVSPLFDELKAWEISDCEIINEFETVAA